MQASILLREFNYYIKKHFNLLNYQLYKHYFNNDIIKLSYSFGYDCKKRSNLHLLDNDTIVFSAGNFVQLLNIKTKEQKYLKTLSGGAVGALAVHSTRKYFAVGEKGCQPSINVYEYPSLKLFRVLKQGTTRGYAYLDYK